MKSDEFPSGGPAPPEYFEEPGGAAPREREEQLVRALRALGEDLRRIEAPPRVGRAALEAFRRQVTPGALRGPTPRFLVGAWAVALAATIFLAVILVHPRAPEQTRHRVRSLTQLATVDMPAPAAAASEPGEGDFVPLPNADTAETAEEINIVRVELPRSAMIPLGYSVTAERAGETIEADVLLDSDGVARAVRFVDPERGTSR